VQLKWGAEQGCTHSILFGAEFQAGSFSILNDKWSIAM
jgi:hypothetical protein